jgi:IclR family acetate operon transcriptional repressor
VTRDIDVARINHSTLKALEVLEMLAAAEDGLRLTEIANGSGFPISTTRRLLVSLIERHYVEQDPESGRYFPGTQILTLQAHGIRRRHIGRRAYPLLSRLRQELDETVNLGILSGASVVYLETLAPDSSFAFYAPPGTRMPLHCTAMGKVLLAFLRPELQMPLIGSLELVPHTPRSLTSAPTLRAELDAVVRRGFAVDNEEYALGVRCLAAPVRDHSGNVVAGVSVTVPATRLPPERVEDVAARLVETCRAISRGLGYGEADRSPQPLPAAGIPAGPA